MRPAVRFPNPYHTPWSDFWHAERLAVPPAFGGMCWLFAAADSKALGQVLGSPSLHSVISSPSLGRAWKVFQVLVCVQNVLILCPTVCVPHWLSSLYPIVFWIQPPVPDGIPKLKYLFPVFDCSWNIGRKLKGKTANWWCDMMWPLVNLLWLSFEIDDQ